MTNYTVENDRLLEEARYEIFRHLLPSIVCMIVSGIAGLVGNALAFSFYAFKTKRATTVVLIACLSVVDFIVCVMFIPNIAEMWVNVKYTQTFMCKLAHFIGLWTVASSGFILWLVAIDRHRKICSPFGRQLTIKTVKYAVIGVIVFGFFLSVRNFVNFDTVEIDVIIHDRVNRTITGYYCTTRDDRSFTTSVKLFTTVDFLLMLMIWLTLVTAYTHIIFTLIKLQKTKKRNSVKQKAGGGNSSNLSNTTELSETPKSSKEVHTLKLEQRSICSSREDGPIHSLGKTVMIHEQPDNTSNIKDYLKSEPSPDEVIPKSIDFLLKHELKGKQTTVKIQENSELPGNVTPIESYTRDKQRSTITPEDHSSSHVSTSLQDSGTLSSDGRSKAFTYGRPERQKKLRASARERKLTFKMLTVSVVFILCFTPYFIVKILMREVLDSGQEYELSLLSQIALRLPYMNSVFNPVVYCVFNPHFRVYIKVVLTSCVSK